MSVRARIPTVGVIGLLAAALLMGCVAETSAPEAEPPATLPPSPAAPAPPSPEQQRRERAEAWIDNASTRELAGSVIMATLPSTDPALLHSLMAETGLGGFILMGANIAGGPEELRALTAALTVDPSLPPLVAIDEEGGIVTRLPWDGLPGADVLREAPPADTAAAFAGRGSLLAEVGANVNFGIVADVTADPWSFIYWRTLGDDPASTAERVAAAVEGEGDAVASTLKHFPGHGAVPDDSHFAVPSTELSFEAWRASAAVPFEAGIDAGAELLMFGHLAYLSISPTPASLAPEWYRIARDDLGFEGLTITDDLAMLQASGLPEYEDVAANSIAALAAGADIVLTVSGMDYDGVMWLVDQVAAAIDSGTLAEDRVREAATRVIELRLELAER